MNLELKHRILVEIAISIFLLIFYALVHFYADTFIVIPMFGGADPVFFPKTVSLIVVALSVLLVFHSLRLWINYKKDKLTHHMRTLVTDHEDDPLLRICLYIGVLFLYLLGFYYIGFVYTTPIIIVLVALMLGLKNIFLGAIVAILFTLALDYASLQFLQIMLPKGVLFS